MVMDTDSQAVVSYEPNLSTTHRDKQYHRDNRDKQRRKHKVKEKDAWKKSYNDRVHAGKRSRGEQTDAARDNDPYPGDAPVPKHHISKYSRSGRIDTQAKTKFHTVKFEQEETRRTLAAKQAARSELLLGEQAGYLEVEEDDDDISKLTQADIQDAVDITSAQKHFELKLTDFGPYRLDYTRNGRYLVLGGNRGHVAAIDWQTKNLLCEMNVMETVTDVTWLHQETLFAVSQNLWTYIYDNQGIELHCLKVMDNTLALEFLAHHFLLVAANSKSYLTYIDVSVGQKVAAFSTHMGRLDVMCQNPRNACICLGHTGGTVSMWSPNVRDPLVKMLCHGSVVRSVAIDDTGQYLATSGIDRTMKIWDLRTYRMLQSYKVQMGAGSLSFSQRGLLAACHGNVVQVYEDCCRQTVTRPYLTHRLHSSTRDVQFCPYEDILGVGHAQGFSSLLVPGAGEPNYDALEANPYQTKKQRRHTEVKMLLDKIQPDMIGLDTTSIGQVNTKSMMEQVEEKNKLLFLKPKKIDFVPQRKQKGRSKVGKIVKKRRGMQEEENRETARHAEQEKLKLDKSKQIIARKDKHVLDRFRKVKS